jgi:hypothetical protein
MEIRITSKQILNVLHVLSWIIFLGVCVEAGGFIFNTLYAMLLNPAGAACFWNGIDLSRLYAFDKGYFLVECALMVIVAVLRAIMFYQIIKLLLDKKQSIAKPFTGSVVRFISLEAFIALGIGLFSQMGAEYARWFSSLGIQMPDIEDMRLGGADVWLFMGVVLLVISQVFKRGIEIQQENELTI